MRIRPAGDNSGKRKCNRLYNLHDVNLSFLKEEMIPANQNQIPS